MQPSHWRLTVPAKSETEVEAENFNRWHLVVAASLNLTCVGSIFSIDFLDDAINGFFLDKAANYALSCQLVGMVTMGLSSALCGPFIESRGPRMSMAIATSLVVLGWIFAQLSITFHVYTLLNIGMGVLISAGYGIKIFVSISTVQKWFPDLRGVVTGICIAGMGGGGSSDLKPTPFSFSERATTSLLAWVPSSTTMDFIAFFIFTVLWRRPCRHAFSHDDSSTPPPNYGVHGSDIHCIPLNKAPTAAHGQNNYLDVGMTLVNYDVVGQNQSSTTDGIYFSHVKALSLGQCILSSDFFFLYAAFAASVAPNLVLAFEMSEFVTEILGVTDRQANFVLLYISISYALGNLLGPVLADVIIRVFYANPAHVRTMVFTALLLSQSVGIAVLLENMGNIDMLQWPLYIAAFSSGGGFCLIPSFLADMFGLYNAGTMYGLILTALTHFNSIPNGP
ncbi:hypothetical protein AeRB84_015328 [Aphanomyces euteiches]|nr:hypothetical protein AeRB84_015328 [Aphanomyces euteiches]